MGDHDIVNFRLAPRKKLRWEHAVEESSEYELLTHLIKLSVEREPADEHTVAEQPGSTADVGLTPIEDELGEVTDRLDGLQSQIELIVDEYREDEMEELTTEVLNHIPTVTKDKREEIMGNIHKSPIKGDNPKHVNYIADELNEPVYRVQKAVNRIAEEFPHVEIYESPAHTSAFAVVDYTPYANDDDDA